jgi:hypothetical protein
MNIVFLKWECPQHCLFWLMSMFFLHRGTAAGYSHIEVITNLVNAFLRSCSTRSCMMQRANMSAWGMGDKGKFQTPQAQRVRDALIRLRDVPISPRHHGQSRASASGPAFRSSRDARRTCSLAKRNSVESTTTWGTHAKTVHSYLSILLAPHASSQEGRTGK